MSAVPQSLREGAFGLGATRMKVSLRVVFPAALSGIVAALVLGASRADRRDARRPARGRLRAAAARDRHEPARVGRVDGLASSPPRRRATPPTGSIEYQTIFAVGFLLFVVTLRAEHDLDPRSSTASGRCTNDGHRRHHRPRRLAQTPPRCPRAAGPSRSGCSGSRSTRRSRSARSCWSRCWCASSPRAAAAVSTDLFTNQPSKIFPEPGGHPVGHRRDALPDGAVRADRRPDRRRHGDLPRGVRGPRAGGTTG